MDMAFDAIDELSDDALIVLYGNGDRAAAAALTARLTPLVFSLAMRMLNDRAEAEDLTQEAMLRLWRMAPDWEPGAAKVSTWLYQVAANLARDRLRKRRGLGLDEVPEPQDDTPGVEVAMIGKDRAEALHRALDRLPERQKEAVVLRHIEGLSNPEIADVLKIGVEAVESLTSRGKRKLKELLLGQKQELGLEE